MSIDNGNNIETARALSSGNAARGTEGELSDDDLTDITGGTFKESLKGLEKLASDPTKLSKGPTIGP
jgi:hypothetical protein